MIEVPASSDRWAFKEWAVVCRALVAGRQDVILRKGGLVEPDGQFRLEASEFLLLPTFLHQSAESILPEDRDLLENIEADRPPEGLACFTHSVQVTDAFMVADEAALAGLRSRHIWSDAVVAERFNRWEQRLDALVVAVTPLPFPLYFPWHDSYGGCKSWVQIHGEPVDRVRQ